MLSADVVSAQDTTWVQTYTFDSLWTRRAKFYFPTANHDYRKVLMYFNIKCYNGVSGDGNYACGEWDYIYFNKVYDHRGTFDSSLIKGRYFTVNGQGNIDTLRYAATPQYDLYRSYLYNTVVDNITSSASYTVGTAATPMPHPFNLAAGKERGQFIWKASELTAAGLTAGNITGIRLNFQSNAAVLNNVMIRMRAVNTDSFSINAMTNDSLKNVYYYNKTISTAGLNGFQFNTPFIWDGVSNILVDFSFENAAPAAANPLLGGNTSYPAGLYSTTTNFAMSAFENKGGNIRFDKALNMFSGTVPRSYEMWINVDSFIAPEGTLFSAGIRGTNNSDFTFRTTSPDNNYRLNLWGNDPAFSGPNTKKVWKHLAVTYGNDTFRFYINGALALEQRRTGVNTITSGDFFLGESRETGYNYLGKFSHLRIWDKVLTGTEIQQWMGRDVTSGHPQFSHLKADYRINTGNGNTVTDVSAAAQPSGLISGKLWWQAVKSKDIYYNAQPLNWRPQVVFERNVYVSHTDSVLTTDTSYRPPSLVRIYGNPGANRIIRDEDPLNPSRYTSAISAWTYPFTYIYRNGVKIDSLPNTLSSVLYNQNISWYSNTVDYEIGRSISPYGINLDLGAGRARVYDLTDYYPILQDTVDLEVGSTQELQDVKFAFIKGNPPAVVNRILQPWGTGWKSYSYGDIASNTVLAPMTMNLQPNTDQVKFRSYVSGHGGSENSGPSYPNGCCEFMYNDHYYLSGAQTVNTFRIQRKDCGYNPIYPQGGTWVYDREGWCPGDIITGHDYNVTQFKSGNQINLDYQISPIPAGGGNVGNGRYNVGLQVIEYRTPGRNNDAELYDILKPSDAFALSRINPICTMPQVVIRNSGKNPLTQATIKYKVSGGQEETINWTGQLKFLDTTVVNLPISSMNFWAGDNSKRFIARISSANGGTDEYAGNDTSYSSYQIPDIFSVNKIIVRFKTNSRPAENELTLRDFSGNVLLHKTNLTANTFYRDTLTLPYGCYTLVLDDAGNDGLTWWASPGQGNGNLTLQNAANGQTLKAFNSDFGAQVFYTFTTQFGLSINNTELAQQVSVFPNPNNGDFTLQTEGFNGHIDVSLTNIVGQQLLNDGMDCYGGTVQKKYNTKLPAGIYMLHITNGTSVVNQKLIIK